MKTQAAPASRALRTPAASMRCSPEPASTGCVRETPPRRTSDLFGTRGLDPVEKVRDPRDVRLLVVVLVEHAGEAHRIARVVPLVELLPPREARDRGIVGETEEPDAFPGVGPRRLEVPLHILRSRPFDLRE